MQEKKQKLIISLSGKTHLSVFIIIRLSGNSHKRPTKF